MKPRLNYPALAVGACLAVALLFCVAWKIEYLTMTEVATGKVTHLDFGGHHPEIAFQARDGRLYERPISSLWSVQPGQAVQIRYEPDDPTLSATMDTFADLWVGILFLATLTGGFLVGGMRGLPFKGGGQQ